MGPLGVAIRVGPEWEGDNHTVIAFFSVWPSGGPFQPAHSDGQPEGGCHPVGVCLFQFGHPEGGSHPVGPFNFTIRMGSRKVGAIRWV